MSGKIVTKSILIECYEAFRNLDLHAAVLGIDQLANLLTERNQSSPPRAPTTSRSVPPVRMMSSTTPDNPVCDPRPCNRELENDNDSLGQRF